MCNGGALSDTSISGQDTVTRWNLKGTHDWVLYKSLILRDKVPCTVGFVHCSTGVLCHAGLYPATRQAEGTLRRAVYKAFCKPECCHWVLGWLPQKHQSLYGGHPEDERMQKLRKLNTLLGQQQASIDLERGQSFDKGGGGQRLHHSMRQQTVQSDKMIC